MPIKKKNSSKKKSMHQVVQYIMMTPTGYMMVIEPFGFYWTFDGLTQLGFWKSRQKMIEFYRNAFGFEYIGRV